MMELQSTVTTELKVEEQKYDFLFSVIDKVKRIDELHPSDDNDSYYVFNVWVDADDDEDIVNTIKENTSRYEGWTCEVHSTGCGLIVVFLWL